MSFWGKITVGKCHFHHLISRIQTVNMTSYWHDVNVDRLAEIVFGRFLHCKVIPLSSFSCCTFWKEVTMCNPHLTVGSYASSSWRQNIYINYTKFCIALPISSQLFTYSIIHISRDSSIFFTLDYIPMLLFPFCCSNCPTLGQWDLFQLPSDSFWNSPSPTVFFF